jgi:lipopolysaccharide/colanic/teichoic acid biosynthesis glycosyltransferase
MQLPMAKRLIDLAGATLLLVLAAPVMLCAAATVYLTMGRPVLFRQRRAGYRSRPFTLLKFRTMREAAGPDGRPLPDGQRVTRAGRLLRRTSLDELPQLLCVLAGSMSLVGPRPLLPEYLDRYTPEQARRHDVKPGLTGWAQVIGRNSISWEEKFRLDVWYADHWNLGLDVLILFRTIWKIVCRDGVSHGRCDTMPEFMGSKG